MDRIYPVTSFKKRKPLLEGSEAFFFSLLYVASATAEISIVKALNYKVGMTLPIFVALALNQAWILMVPGYLLQRRRVTSGYTSTLSLLQPSLSQTSSPTSHTEGNTSTLSSLQPPSPILPSSPTSHTEGRFQLMKAYATMTFLVFLVTFFRSFGVNFLPGSEAALLSSSSMIYTLLFSKIFLKRQFNLFHYAAGIVGLLGLISLALGRALAHKSHSFSPSSFAAPAPTPTRYILGSISCVLAAIFVSLMSVTSNKITHMFSTNKQLRVTEMTLLASAGASALLVPALFIVGEYKEWKDTLSEAWNSAFPLRRTLLLTFVLLLPVCKALVRSSKYSTIAHSSAFVFEFVQAASSISGSIANILIFQEPFTWGIISSICLTTLGFILYLRAQALVEKKHHHHQQQQQQQQHNNEHTPMVDTYHREDDEEYKTRMPITLTLNQAELNHEEDIYNLRLQEAEDIIPLSFHTSSTVSSSSPYLVNMASRIPSSSSFAAAGRPTSRIRQEQKDEVNRQLRHDQVYVSTLLSSP